MKSSLQRNMQFILIALITHLLMDFDKEADILQKY